MTVFQILVFRNNAWIKLRIMFVNALKDLQEKNCDENVDDCIKNPGLSHINGYTTTHKYILYNSRIVNLTYIENQMIEKKSKKKTYSKR